jgi:hypothetical protein
VLGVDLLKGRNLKFMTSESGFQTHGFTVVRRNSFCFVLFWWDWGLNSGLHTC